MKLRITVQGTSYDVDVEVLDGGVAAAPAAVQAAPARAAAPVALPPRPAAAAPAAGGAKNLVSPIAGTVVQVKVKAGDTVTQNQVALVMEAMKMETNIAAPAAAKVKAVRVKAGEAVKAGQVLVEFE